MNAMRKATLMRRRVILGKARPVLKDMTGTMRPAPIRRMILPLKTRLLPLIKGQLSHYSCSLEADPYATFIV